MISFLVSSVTGWFGAIFVACEILLPYLLRRTVLSQTLGLAPAHKSNRLERMWPHYWLGYLIVFLSLARASFTMGPQMGRTSRPGLMAAMLAISCLFLEILLGLLLQDGTLSRKRLIRRFHFSVMLMLVAFLSVHLWLNG